MCIHPKSTLLQPLLRALHSPTCIKVCQAHPFANTLTPHLCHLCRQCPPAKGAQSQSRRCRQRQPERQPAQERGATLQTERLNARRRRGSLHSLRLGVTLWRQHLSSLQNLRMQGQLSMQSGSHATQLTVAPPAVAAVPAEEEAPPPAAPPAPAAAVAAQHPRESRMARVGQELAQAMASPEVCSSAAASASRVPFPQVCVAELRQQKPPQLHSCRHVRTCCRAGARWAAGRIWRVWRFWRACAPCRGRASKASCATR